MNRVQRKSVQSTIDEIKATLIHLNDIIQKEKISMNNIPLSLKETKQYKNVQSSYYRLNDAKEKLESAVFSLKEVL